MMTTGADPLFVDTNILVYANVTTAALHQAAVAALQDHARAGSPLWISRQVLREYLRTFTRPQTFADPPPIPTLVARIRYFEAHFYVADDTAAVTAELLALLQQVPFGGKQVHDANIVATMRVNGIRRLLTANAADFTRFAGYITVHPLV
ncbi:MAG TPA: type II toxin-antitoxin system VapC family toxin [Chloroflexia bacterium]|nr:type II toxin-antitoxin system VapC family toxin [Chloroflexia bacterium]